MSRTGQQKFPNGFLFGEIKLNLKYEKYLSVCCQENERCQKNKLRILSFF
jgi:hypothetical protein